MVFFSIITVTKDNLAGLQKTYNSLPAPDPKLWEWIVIDGASSDDTPQWLETLTGINFTSNPDSGIYDAMNKGLSMAKGSYVMFLNAGDMLTTPDMLAKIYRDAQQNKADIFYGDALENGAYKPARSHNAGYYGLFTHYPSILFKRLLLKDMNHDLRYPIAADYDFTLRALERSSLVIHLPYAIADFEAGGISQRLPAQGRMEQFQIRRSRGMSYLRNCTIYSRQIIALGLKRLYPAFYWLLRSRYNKHSAKRPA